MAFVPKGLPDTETGLPETRVREMFDMARKMTRNQPPEDRRIAVVTPGRNIIPFMCPPPGSMPPPMVEPIEDLFPSSKPLQIAVIAYTEMSHFIDEHGQNPEGANEVIPFFGYLLGMGYVGHSVVIFEGHPSALGIGCDLADALVVDDAIIRFLPKDWGEQALRGMRREQIIIFGRDGQLSAYQTPLPPDQQLTGAMSKEAEKAMAYMEKGDVRNSLAILDKAIERWSGNAFLYYLRGRYSQQVDMRRAYADLSQAVKLDPTNPQFWLTRGNVAADATQHETAIKNYNRVIELRPNQPMTYQNRAISFLEIKALKQAYQDLNNAIQLDPAQPNFYYYRGLVLLKGNKPQLALEQLNHAIDMVPAGEFIIQRAMAYAMLGDEAKALRDADAAREKAGIRVLWECCEVYEQLRRDDDLLQLLDVARSFADRLEEMKPGRKQEIEQKISETRRRLGRL